MQRLVPSSQPSGTPRTHPPPSAPSWTRPSTWAVAPVTLSTSTTSHPCSAALPPSRASSSLSAVSQLHLAATCPSQAPLSLPVASRPHLAMPCTPRVSPTHPPPSAPLRPPSTTPLQSAPWPPQRCSHSGGTNRPSTCRLEGKGLPWHNIQGSLVFASTKKGVTISL